jgi:hypothetical protein
VGRSKPFEQTYPLEAGEWTASIAFEELGYLEREFQILADRETEVVIHRNDVTLYEGFLSLSGKVTFPDGSPVNDLALLFRAYSVPSLERKKTELETLTDGDGAFHIQGFKPGRWWVGAQEDQGSWIIFPHLWIPPDAEDPFLYHLIMPRGEVHGALLDRMSGFSITHTESRPWDVKLIEVDKLCEVGRLEGGKVGNHFYLRGISEGRYQLRINAEGYFDYRTSPFTLQNNQVVDLGKILLEPSGLLDLEVVDTELQPVESYWLFCDGRPRRHDRKIEGKRRYDELPLGQVLIKVFAKGYLEQSITIKLEPAQPVEARVVLHPR